MLDSQSRANTTTKPGQPDGAPRIFMLLCGIQSTLIAPVHHILATLWGHDPRNLPWRFAKSPKTHPLFARAACWDRIFLTGLEEPLGSIPVWASTRNINRAKLSVVGLVSTKGPRGQQLHPPSWCPHIPPNTTSRSRKRPCASLLASPRLEITSKGDTMKNSPQDSSDNNTVSQPQEDGGGLAVRARRLWHCPIDSNLANLPLLACCLVTGLLDTTMFQGKKLFLPFLFASVPPG